MGNHKIMTRLTELFASSCHHCTPLSPAPRQALFTPCLDRSRCRSARPQWAASRRKLDRPLARSLIRRRPSSCSLVRSSFLDGVLPSSFFHSAFRPSFGTDGRTDGGRFVRPLADAALPSRSLALPADGSFLPHSAFWRDVWDEAIHF